MDGLMLDTERLAMQSLRRAAQSLRLHFPNELLIELIGLNENDANALIEKRLGIPIPKEELSVAFYQIYEETISSNGIPIKAGLIELLDFLKEKNIKLGVATSTKTDLAHKKLKLAGIQDRFDVIIGGDQVTQGKPAPDSYLKAANSLGVNVNHCLALEDSDNGAASANNAKIKVIVVPDIKTPSPETQSIAREILPSLVEVKEYISRYIS